MTQELEDCCRKYRELVAKGALKPTFSGNAPFYVVMHRARESLSKHEPKAWLLHHDDGELLALSVRIAELVATTGQENQDG
jgi:hypothetical protein